MKHLTLKRFKALSLYLISKFLIFACEPFSKFNVFIFHVTFQSALFLGRPTKLVQILSALEAGQSGLFSVFLVG